MTAKDLASAQLRVERVLSAGGRIADPADALGREARARLASTSGLTPEGIELALDEHLERHASDAELSAFVGAATPVTRCQVVLSANVCTGALRSIAFAIATAPDVEVKPSRRDPVVAELVLRALADDVAFGRAGGSVRLIGAEDVAVGGPGALHVYGSDATIAAIAAKAPASTHVRGHGAGLGVALIDRDADLDAAAAALARDVVPFDQRGCLSPRFALVAGGSLRGERFAAALHRALGEIGARIPRGALDDATRQGASSYGATMRAVGLFHEGAHHAVGFDPAPRALLLPPAARVMHVVAIELADAPALLAPFASHLTMLGLTSSIDPAFTGLPCRRAPLGRMQKPPFDGPVDLRPYRRAALA